MKTGDGWDLAPAARLLTPDPICLLLRHESLEEAAQNPHWPPAGARSAFNERRPRTKYEAPARPRAPGVRQQTLGCGRFCTEAEDMRPLELTHPSGEGHSQCPHRAGYLPGALRRAYKSVHLTQPDEKGTLITPISQMETLRWLSPWLARMHLGCGLAPKASPWRGLSCQRSKRHIVKKHLGQNSNWEISASKGHSRRATKGEGPLAHSYRGGLC